MCFRGSILAVEQLSKCGRMNLTAGFECFKMEKSKSKWNCVLLRVRQRGRVNMSRMAGVEEENKYVYIHHTHTHTHTHRYTSHTCAWRKRGDYLYYVERFTIEHWFMWTWRMASPNSAGQARDPGRNWHCSPRPDTIWRHHLLFLIPLSVFA